MPVLNTEPLNRLAIKRISSTSLNASFHDHMQKVQAAQFVSLRWAVRRLAQRQLASTFVSWREAALEQRRLVNATGHQHTKIMM